ncbi:acyl-CoA dehydrogenase family protein [Pseudonocardia alaniniphila]|uniref:Acyl-CoA dehydrogenase family protein n=1 Tax=Pseudonocardia alaniniphila TaxID=75291 RepID=A0ABS9TRI3_9PSEU|nr:acyl-CoA dehydrogenase family protein [Pseudonocardia alaniniphila]MCH6170978.1 acyl-CoA dehydrogenase family protein [Pseudonocardia alaniniphila]
MQADNGSALDGGAVLANVEKIRPLLREHAAEGEAARRLTEPVVDALRSTGVFRMAMPAAWGGPEVDICRQIEIIETLSRADASAGWCAMIGSDSGFYSGYLDDAAARSLYPHLDAVTAGWVSPVGTLDVSDGGYRLSGRWSFGSGVTHADVIVGGARVTENGSPRLLADGTPEARIAMLPAAQWQVLDTWSPLGMAGSGSHDYAINDAFVPAENTWVYGQSYRSGPLYRWRGMFVVNFFGVPVGVALDACEVAASILDGKLLMPEMTPARNEPYVRADIARARAMVGAARSYVYDTVGTIWSTVVAGDEPSLEQRAQLVGLFAHTVSECRTAVRLLVDTVGTVAIQDGCPLGRQMRDLDTIAQHVVAKRKMWEWAGGMYFGQDPPLPFL